MGCTTAGMLIAVKGNQPYHEPYKTKDNSEGNSSTNYYTSLPEVFVLRQDTVAVFVRL
jgi:hypothetical protein